MEDIKNFNEETVVNEDIEVIDPEETVVEETVEDTSNGGIPLGGLAVTAVIGGVIGYNIRKRREIKEKAKAYDLEHGIESDDKPKLTDKVKSKVSTLKDKFKKKPAEETKSVEEKKTDDPETKESEKES